MCRTTRKIRTQILVCVFWWTVWLERNKNHFKRNIIFMGLNCRFVGLFLIIFIANFWPKFYWMAAKKKKKRKEKRKSKKICTLLCGGLGQLPAVQHSLVPGQYRKGQEIWGLCWQHHTSTKIKFLIRIIHSCALSCDMWLYVLTGSSPVSMCTRRFFAGYLLI